MKTLLIFLVVLGMSLAVNAQIYKIKYTSYKSEVLDEKEGLLKTNKKYKETKASINKKSNTLSITKGNNIIANLIYNNKYKAWIGGGIKDNISNYLQANIEENSSVLRLNILTSDTYSKKVLENIVLIYQK